MRRTITRFLLVRFAGIFLFVIFTLTSLLVLFDLLAHADDLAVHHTDTFLPMAWYAGLRLPVLLAMITPLSVLLAALVTFDRLATQYELVALQSAGVSIYQTCAVLLIGGLAVSALHFGLASVAATPAGARLFRWTERNYEGLPDRSALEPGSAWFAAGDTRIHISNAHDQGRLLDHVIMIEQGMPGVITSYAEARTARHDGAGWLLVDGWVQNTEGGPLDTFAARNFEIALTPQQVAQVRLPVSSLDSGTLRRLSEGSSEVQPFPVRIYRTWLGRRYAEPLGSLVMILLAAPLGLQLRRSGRMLLWGTLGIGAGFLFFISERILLAFGESGALAPGLAVWSPITAFGLAGIVTLVFLQK